MNQNGETTQQDVVTKEELKGFYSFTVATEGYSAMALAVFFPLILKTLTAEVAFERNDHSIPCDTSSEVHCDALFFGRYIDTSSAVLYSTSISVLLQFLLFTTLGILVLKLGSLADYGPRRLQFMIGFSVVTAIVGGLISAVFDESLYLVAYLIYIVSNTTFGASFVFLYAWIPVLTKASKEVIEADNDPYVSDEEFYVISDRVANTISSRSFFVGYIAAVCQLIISAGIVVLAGDGTKWGLPKTYPMQICITAICIWQLIIIFSYTKRLMKPRPGPLLPKVGATLKQANKLKQLFLFLIGWFVYSDSFSTVAHVAILFAQSELKAGRLITKLGTPLLLLCATIVPLMAGIGAVLWVKFQRAYNFTTKSILIMQAIIYSLVPLYGVVGFYVPRGTFLGLQNEWELPLVGAVHGFLLGATQSSCRVIFSELLPHGHESEFFGLYEITDKGSSWLGPLIVGMIAEWTGSLRHSFLFLAGMFIIPLVIFILLDIPKGKKEARAFIAKEDRHHVKHLVEL